MAWVSSRISDSPIYAYRRNRGYYRTSQTENSVFGDVAECVSLALVIPSQMPGYQSLSRLTSVCEFVECDRPTIGQVVTAVGGSYFCSTRSLEWVIQISLYVKATKGVSIQKPSPETNQESNPFARPQLTSDIMWACYFLYPLFLSISWYIR